MQVSGPSVTGSRPFLGDWTHHANACEKAQSLWNRPISCGKSSHVVFNLRRFHGELASTIVLGVFGQHLLEVHLHDFSWNLLSLASKEWGLRGAVLIIQLTRNLTFVCSRCSACRAISVSHNLSSKPFASVGKTWDFSCHGWVPIPSMYGPIFLRNINQTRTWMVWGRKFWGSCNNRKMWNLLTRRYPDTGCIQGASTKAHCSGPHTRVVTWLPSKYTVYPTYQSRKASQNHFQDSKHIFFQTASSLDYFGEASTFKDPYPAKT